MKSNTPFNRAGKIAILLLVLKFSITATSGQETKTIQASDGSMFEYTLLLNEPENYSKFGVLVGLNAAYNAKHIIPGLLIDVHGQITKGLFIRGNARFGFPISISRDNYWEEFPDANKTLRPYRKMYQNHDLQFGIKLWGGTKKKATMIILDEESAGYNQTRLYYKKEKVDFRRTLSLTLGVDYIQRRMPASFPLVDTDMNGGDNGNTVVEYRAVSILNNNIRVGLDWRLATFNIKEVDNEVLPEYQDMSLYTQLLIPVRADVNVISLQENGLGLFDLTPIIEEVNEGFNPVELNNLGFVLGVRVMNATNFRKRHGFSLETGMYPGPKTESFTANFFVSLGVCMGFGTDLKKQLDK